ncbi:MAG: 16S rRNA (cytosine(967)-C(5))-methyltransferase RsmB [Ruminococcus sp.]|nr:16S rRNA (cytosine(967)-C(5))-methyltransferase RsmB [Ruminococcus sp.]
MQARQLVVSLLDQLEKSNSYSNIALDHMLEKTELSTQDKKFCSALFYGVIERKLTLDAVISKYSKKPLSKLDCTICNILRTGLYQILYMSQVPSSAAVNESVKLTKKFRKTSASGFVNAVLRGFLRDDCKIPLPKNEMEALSIKYSVPVWLVTQTSEIYGMEKAESFFENALLPPPITIRRNSVLSSEDEFLNEFKDYDIEKHSVLPDAYILKSGNVKKISAFEKGLFHVQDVASQFCCMALDAKPDEIIFDVCSAPGGKTFTISEYMNNTGKIYAFDLQNNRVSLIKQGAERLKLTNIIANQGDASVYNSDLPKADRVLCDVPCSGLGVIRRKPEIRYKTKESFNDLPDLQFKILENASQYVKDGGTLVYSTCTISKYENENVVERFLKNHKEFILVPVIPELGGIFNESMVTLFPDYCNSDGFFFAKLYKIKEGDV